MEFHELQQIVESNSRAIQAMLEAQATDRLKHEEQMDEIRASIARLDAIAVRQEDLMEHITNMNEGIIRLVSSLDDDRPTILGRLSRIENKVDRLLQQQRNIDGGT